MVKSGSTWAGKTLNIDFMNKHFYSTNYVKLSSDLILLFLFFDSDVGQYTLVISPFNQLLLLNIVDLENLVTLMSKTSQMKWSKPSLSFSYPVCLGSNFFLHRLREFRTDCADLSAGTGKLCIFGNLGIVFISLVLPKLNT